MNQQQVERVAFLSGWKDISTYLGKSVRSVQRYERTTGLPIRRPAGGSRGSVIAIKAELDGWVNASPLSHEFRSSRERPKALTPVLEALTQSVVTGQQLRDEMVRLTSELRSLHAALRESIGTIKTNARNEVSLPSYRKESEGVTHIAIVGSQVA